MSLYFYDGAWQVASSGRADARGPLGTRSKVTMAHGFWEIFAARGLKLPSDEFAGWWFGWEMTTPWNQVVVRHDAPQITLIGARDAAGRERFPDEIAPLWGWPCVRSRELRDLDSVLNAAEEIEAFTGEGFVVCDADFSRVKIKSSRYVALHLMRDSFSMRRLVDIVRTGEDAEFLAYFPEYAARAAKISALYEKLVAQIESDFARLNPIESPHEFAREAQKTRFPPAVFALRNKKVSSARDFLVAAQLPLLLRCLGLRDAEIE